MQLYNVYFEFCNFSKCGLVPKLDGGAARDIFEHYEAGSERQKAGIRSCWVTKSGDALAIRGASPSGWSPDDPHYENC